MASVADQGEINPEHILPWEGEATRIDALMERQGGEWVVAAAFLDYTYLTEVTRPHRLAFGPRQRPLGEVLGGKLMVEMSRRESEAESVIEAVEAATEELAEVIPIRQREQVLAEGQMFLEGTAGHFAVQKLVDLLQQPPQQLAA